MPFTLIPQNSISGGVGDSLRPNAKPLIINGNMAVAQRGTSFSPSGSSTTYTIDRYALDVTGSATGDATITQESDAPASTNLRKSLKISPDATETLSGGENIVFTTSLEGQDVQVLGHGTSSPPKATLSFWVKSSKTGTYCVQIKEEGVSNESYLLYEYSISSADTWEQKIFSWTGNTAHTLNNDNAMGFRIVWHLAVGSDDHASATTSWTQSTAFKATSNQVNFFDSTSNSWYLTGVQLEVGEYTSSTLPSFQHESYEENLARCQRYFAMIAEGNNIYFGSGGYYSSSNITVDLEFPVTMRTAPSIYQVTGTNYFALDRQLALDYVDSFTLGNNPSTNRAIAYNNSQGSGTSGVVGWTTTGNASAKIGVQAEL